MIIIQQAIYGEIPGQTSGHDLLSASYNKIDFFKKVSGYTDLADRPGGGVLSTPIVRGFYVEDHYLLVKNFPDESPGLRSGRVFAHTLFIPKADLRQIANLSHLFQFHLPYIKKTAKISPIEYQPSPVKITRDPSLREIAAADALLQDEPLVWLGEEGYWEWIGRIWPQLPLKIKCNVKVGAAFSPTYAKEEHTNLLYIPDDAKPLWEHHDFRVIGKEAKGTLQSAATRWLLGNSEEVDSFQTLLEDFSPKIDSIDLLKRLQASGKVYHQLDGQPQFARMLVLSYFISGVNPDEKSGVKGKNKLIDAIVRAIPTAQPNRFAALYDQTWKGFPNALERVTKAMNSWFDNHLFDEEQSKEVGGVLLKALKAEEKNWWTRAVQSHVEEQLREWQPTYAPVVWQWMKNEPALVTEHASWLPGNRENELAHTPPVLETELAEKVLNMARQKNWLILHAKVAARCLPADKAIQAQLHIDTNEAFAQGLEILCENIDKGKIIDAATNRSDIRLHRIAGKFIAQDKTLLKDIDISNKQWQHCWMAAIEQGASVWSGIPEPRRTLFKILDHLLAGNSFSRTLLNAISNEENIGLKNYPNRKAIWKTLPAKIRSKFIVPTIKELIDEVADGEIKYSYLEKELQEELQSKEVLQQLISNNMTLVIRKLRLFNVIPKLDEGHAVELINGNRFEHSESRWFGQLISRRKWVAAADELFEQRHRSDLRTALFECSHLLGLLKRFKLSASGVKRDAITVEEWWDEFLKISLMLFPKGPEQDGLWERAGGELSQLYIYGTGQEKWQRAIQILRYNGTSKVGKLIKKMRELYPSNNHLQSLQDTL